MIAVVMARGSSAYPDARWSVTDLRSRLDERIAFEPAGAGAVHLDELVLACACLLGSARALAELEQRYIADVVPNLKRLGLDETERDEVLQQLRERLLVGAGGREPALERYAGRGSLGGFVRTAAVRLGVDLMRARRPVVDGTDAIRSAAAGEPELSYMKRRYAGEFDAAVRRALAAMPADQRLFLRHQLIDGLTIDDLARLYAVHRSTAARRCAAARAALVAGTRGQLASRLGVTPPTADSIIRLLSSRVHSRIADALG